MVTKPKVEATITKKKDAQGRTVGATGSYIAKDVIPKTEDRIERKETIRLLPIKKKKIVYRGNPGSGKADAVEVDD